MSNTSTVQADVTVDNCGTIWVFTPQTDKARDWIRENIDEDDPNLRPDLSFTAEHRPGMAIAEGMAGDGLYVPGFSETPAEVTYTVYRYFRDDHPKEAIHEGLTLDEARAHCSDPSTGGTDPVKGPYFDGYERVEG